MHLVRIAKQSSWCIKLMGASGFSSCVRPAKNRTGCRSGPINPPKRITVAWQKSVDILDYKYKTPLKEGLTKMWDWAQQQPMRDRFIWPLYELDKGIYSFWKK